MGGWRIARNVVYSGNGGDLLYNPGHNILRHFDVWQNFRVTTSETNGDY